MTNFPYHLNPGAVEDHGKRLYEEAQALSAFKHQPGYRAMLDFIGGDMRGLLRKLMDPSVSEEQAKDFRLQFLTIQGLYNRLVGATTLLEQGEEAERQLALMHADQERMSYARNRAQEKKVVEMEKRARENQLHSPDHANRARISRVNPEVNGNGHE